MYGRRLVDPSRPRSLGSRRGSAGWTLALAGWLVGCQTSDGQAQDGAGSDGGTMLPATAGDDDGSGGVDGGSAGPGTGDSTAGSGDDSGDGSTGDAPCDTPKACADADEADTAAAMEALRRDPDGLLAFLVAMPKGGDLHHHLSGAVYAETYLDWAQQSGNYCIQSSDLSLSTACGDGNDVPIPTGRRDLFLDVLRAWSMFQFVPSGANSGADHFFSTFGKFGAISGTQHGRMLADVRRRAASENVLYIEPMLTSNNTARNLGEDLWQQQGGGALAQADYAGFHLDLLAAAGFSAARQRLLDDANDNEAIAQTELSCATAQPKLGCEVATRYQVYISRSGSDQGVFAQMVAAYEAAAVEPRIVGLNLVGPEDGGTAMANYDRQMAMLGYLGDYYGDSGLSPLRLSLHAGEITPTSVPNGYELDETRHIRKAVEVAGAERIGHGVDVLHEDDPEGLFDLLRQRGVLVEICLASNDIILQVSGPSHPIHEYLAHGVPVALATDDQGVARSSLAAEFYRAVVDQGLDYYELKAMVRASLEYSFLPGGSVWVDAEMTELAGECAPASGQTPGSMPPSAACDSYLSANDRAALQHTLELQLEQFEAAY